MPACQVCGWTAAFAAMLAFGSFGVPIKSEAVQSVNIDPLVFQTYKTTMCFITSWFILFSQDETFQFTKWGIVSGMFWVPGGVATIYAVKAAGLAVGMGVASSCIVLSSFTWGIFVFQERVHSRLVACFAILLLILGLMGMSYFSSPDSSSETTPIPKSIELSRTNSNGSNNNSPSNNNSENRTRTPPPSRRRERSHSGDSTASGQRTRSLTPTSRRIRNSHRDDNKPIEDFSERSVRSVNRSSSLRQQTVLSSNTPKLTNRTVFLRKTHSPANSFHEGSSSDDEEEALMGGGIQMPSSRGLSNKTKRMNATTSSRSINTANETLVIWGRTVSKRQYGMFLAAIFGLWGGSIMAPMKMTDLQGSHFLLSFSIGSAMVNLYLWILRYMCNVFRYRGDVINAFMKLPSFHLEKVWKQGLLCGLLWSIGNFFSLSSVYYLGQGVGYPLVQSQMLVSGLWGIFYFKEVQGRDRIFRWLLSSLVTLTGILVLSYSHVDDIADEKPVLEK